MSTFLIYNIVDLLFFTLEILSLYTDNQHERFDIESNESFYGCDVNDRALHTVNIPTVVLRMILFYGYQSLERTKLGQHEFHVSCK